MRRALLLAVVTVAAAALAAGCIVSHGATPPPKADAAIDVNVGCAGAGCGTGTLFTSLEPDCAGAPIATTSNGGVTLTSSAAFSTGYPTVYAGNYCVSARLVVGSATTLVPSAAPTPFSVADHQTVTLPITIDAVQ